MTLDFVLSTLGYHWISSIGLGAAKAVTPPTETMHNVNITLTLTTTGATISHAGGSPVTTQPATSQSSYLFPPEGIHKIGTWEVVLFRLAKYSKGIDIKEGLGGCHCFGCLNKKHRSNIKNMAINLLVLSSKENSFC